MSGSPDVAQYVDLELVDRDPQDIFDIAVQHMQVSFPEFQPREGMTEVVLLEAVALEVAESIFALNRLPDAITEVLLSFFNITRDIGQQPTADLSFQVSGGQGTTIPVGSRFALETGNGLTPLIFTIDQELAIPQGQDTGTIAATGGDYTDMFNGTPTGTLLTPLDSIVSLDYVRLGSNVTDGRDPETDLEYLTRGVQRMARLSSTLTVPSQFQIAADEFVYVSRSLALDAYNPDIHNPSTDGPDSTGDDPGFMTVAIYGDNEMVSAEHKAEIDSYFDSESNANLITKIIDPTITEIDVNVNFYMDKDAQPDDVVAAVTRVLEDTLNPMSWPWGSVVRRGVIISLITNIDGVDYVDSLVEPATDITLPGVAPLVKLGTLTPNPLN